MLCGYLSEKFEERIEHYWNVSLNPLNELKSTIVDFSYDLLYEEMIVSKLSKIDLLRVSRIVNHSNATVEEELKNEVRKIVETRVRVETNMTHFMDVYVDAVFPMVFFGVDYQFTYNKFEGYEQTERHEARYEISKKVWVPPQTSVKIISYVNWIQNLDLPFTATLRVGGLVPRETSQGFLRPAVANLAEVRALLEYADFDDRTVVSEEEEGNELIFKIKGVFSGSFGLDSVYRVEPLSDEEVAKELKNKQFRDSIKIYP